MRLLRGEPVATVEIFRRGGTRRWPGSRLRRKSAGAVRWSQRSKLAWSRVIPALDGSPDVNEAHPLGRLSSGLELSGVTLPRSRGPQSRPARSRTWSHRRAATARDCWRSRDQRLGPPSVTTLASSRLSYWQKRGCFGWLRYSSLRIHFTRSCHATFRRFCHPPNLVVSTACHNISHEPASPMSCHIVLAVVHPKSFG